MAYIQKQISAQIGFAGILANIETFGFPVNLPVDMPEFVPLIVGLMLSELNAEAVMRTFVQPGDKPLDNRTGFQFQWCNPGQYI